MSSTVSVIIPSFNRAAFLGQAIDSVLGQEHAEVEVIVIDDGSVDGTRELVASTFGADPRVIYRYQANAGASAARNAGLDVATGRYVAFLDSDDSWDPWHLQVLVTALEHHPEAGLIWSNTRYVDPDGAVISTDALASLLSSYRYFPLDSMFAASFPIDELGLDLPSNYEGHRIYVGDVYSPMLMGNLILTSSAVLSRERIDEAGRFDHRLVVGEDYEFFLRTCRAGPVAYVDIADTRYRTGTNDKLGSPSMALAMALGYLEVVTTTLARDRDRIRLSPSLIAEAQAHGHRWVGELQLLAGSRRDARQHLATSLRIRPRQPRIIALLLLTFIPAAATRSIVRLRRRGRTADRLAGVS